MSMPIRAIISMLAGIGSGALGFWVMWKVIAWATNTHPGTTHGAWLVVGIFAPLVAVAVATFWALGGKEQAGSAPEAAS